MNQSQGERPYLLPGSPVLNRQALETKFARWTAGEVVPSEVCEVGFVPMPAECADLLTDSALARCPYSEPAKFEDPLYKRAQPLRDALREVCEADMARADLTGTLRVITRFGMYDACHDKEPLHADYFPSQQVRWTTSHGLPGTIGGLGEISTADLTSPFFGDIDKAKVGKFKLQPSKEGAVMRFTVSDAHSGCDGRGLRIFTFATLILRDRR